MVGFPPSAAPRVSLLKELPVHEAEGRGTRVHALWQGGQRHPSIHSFPHSFNVPSLSTGGVPGPAPAFKAIAIQFDEGR